ncbi:hypothetical protein [Methylobacterium aquaticum]|uniref:Uncharacterized protein n=1 Tax=Methylobacterium aquaticum TaxID=270351 RepID=A0A0J6STS9_9HYPH|nr:hypothetical protein [Methylobacterium aquaticum]KMO36962.1 hypothetical protein VP06_08755 [Methylobacterium aquaticum]
MSVPRPVAASAVPSALPPALAPWAALFAEMPEPDLRVLTALVDALYPLIDRVDGAGAHPEGEIDGVGGLGSRGGIERLVASEWLWRDLDPDAFLQRAAARELLTLEPVYRQAAEAGAVLVVLDAGPDLLGAPRLVAFAALLCLAGLARRRGARLLWVSTAASERGWREGLDAADAALLLTDTAATVLDGAELHRMLAEPAATRATARPGASLWLVGGEDLPEASRPASRVAIAERPRLDPAGLAVAAEVTVASAAGGFARVRLDLPPEAEAMALLRDPFRPRRAPGDRSARPARPQRAEASTRWAPEGFAFAPGAEHLLVARPDGILVMPVLGDGKALVLAVARHDRLAGFDVGPGLIRAAFVTVYADRARIVLRSWNLGGAPQETRFDLRVPRDHPLAQARFPGPALPPLGALKRRDRCWLLAPDGAPFLLAGDRVADYSSLRGAAPIAVVPAALLTRDRTGAVVARSRTDGQVLARFPAGALPPERTGFLDVLAGRSRLVLVAEGADGVWRLTEAWSEETRCVGLPVRPHGRIVGFAMHDPRRHGAAAEHPAALHRDATGLTLRGLDGEPLGDPLALPDDTLDEVRLAVHPRAGPCIAAARRNAAGYVEALALCPLDGPGTGAGTGTWRHLPDLDTVADDASCLRA